MIVYQIEALSFITWSYHLVSSCSSMAILYCHKVALTHMGVAESFCCSPQGNQWQKAKILPYKHVVAAYESTITNLPSQIAYGGDVKKHHVIVLWRAIIVI